MKDSIVVTLTSYGKRLTNLPMVLDTIVSQTVKPDVIVANLAFDEIVPQHVVEYLADNKVVVNRVPDTKVYKKLIPTLNRYPNDIVISIDDDWLYPKEMIEDFMNIHEKYPNNPISGNREVFNGLQCHCGCASLTQKKFFGNLLDAIDEDMMLNCPSDDLVYTYLSLLSGYAYVRTKGLYYLNMVPINCGNSYSEDVVGDLGMEHTHRFLVERFGEKQLFFSSYLQDEHLAVLIDDLYLKKMALVKYKTENEVRSSHAYRLGHFLLKPLSWIKRSV